MRIEDLQTLQLAAEQILIIIFGLSQAINVVIIESLIDISRILHTATIFTSEEFLEKPPFCWLQLSRQNGRLFDQTAKNLSLRKGVRKRGHTVAISFHLVNSDSTRRLTGPGHE